MLETVPSDDFSAVDTPMLSIGRLGSHVKREGYSRYRFVINVQGACTPLDDPIDGCNVHVCFNEPEYLSLSKVFHFHSDSTFVKKVSESLEAQSFKSTGKVWGGICRPRGAFAPRIQSSSHERQRLCRWNSRSSVVTSRMGPRPVNRRVNCSPMLLAPVRSRF